jgi:hypothetical protein
VRIGGNQTEADITGVSFSKTRHPFVGIIIKKPHFYECTIFLKCGFSMVLVKVWL